MKKTVFDIIPTHILELYRNKGFYYEDTNYINVFRWIWNEKHIHPQIMCFPGDIENRATVSMHGVKYNKSERLFCSSYDEAVIWCVETIAKNINDYMPGN